MKKPGTFPTASDHAERLGETQRLATQIADERACDEIWLMCPRLELGAPTRTIVWQDTAAPSDMRDPGQAEALRRRVDRAVKYLDLRGHLIRHPTLPHLVRIHVKKAASS